MAGVQISRNLFRNLTALPEARNFPKSTVRLLGVTAQSTHSPQQSVPHRFTTLLTPVAPAPSPRAATQAPRPHQRAVTVRSAGSFSTRSMARSSRIPTEGTPPHGESTPTRSVPATSTRTTTTTGRPCERRNFEKYPHDSRRNLREINERNIHSLGTKSAPPPIAEWLTHWVFLWLWVQVPGSSPNGCSRLTPRTIGLSAQTWVR